MIDVSLDTLEVKIDQLVRLCNQLAHENTRLRDVQNELLAERDDLINNNDTARTKVENMLHRLKQLEALTHD